MRTRFTLAPVLLAGCTTLGPMAATTGVAPAPIGRPSVEVAVGVAPGYYVSSGVTEDPQGAPIPQLAALVEPDRWIGVPGLVAGARLVGTEDAGTFLEPLAGYRTGFGRVSLGLVGYATRAGADDRDASLAYTRAGGEVGVDVRATPESRWIELHLVAGAALTALWADGRYCVDADSGLGVDCPEPPETPMPIAASAEGLYPSAYAGAAVEVGRHLPSVFHGARLTVQVAGGTMPTAVSGVQEDATTYASVGFSLAVGLGAAD
jgi:hypothetical protein